MSLLDKILTSLRSSNINASVSAEEQTLIKHIEEEVAAAEKRATEFAQKAYADMSKAISDELNGLRNEVRVIEKNLKGLIEAHNTVVSQVTGGSLTAAPFPVPGSAPATPTPMPKAPVAPTPAPSPTAPPASNAAANPNSSAA